jgi:hypothetical protein
MSLKPKAQGFGLGAGLITVGSALLAIAPFRSDVGKVVPVSQRIYGIALASGIALCVIGVLIIAWALAQYVTRMSHYAQLIDDYIKTRITDPKLDRSAALEDDLDAVFEFSRQEFQEEIDDDVKLRMRSWHKKNPEHLWIIYREGRVIVGYFALLPLNKKAARRVDRGELYGASISEDDMVGVATKPSAIYIGGIAAKSKKAKAFAVGVLLERLNKMLVGGVPLYTRPVTKDGHRLVDKYGFLPVRALEIEPPWKVVHKLVKPSVAKMIEPKAERYLAMELARQQSRDRVDV